jgi:hypothetical protein
MTAINNLTALDTLSTGDLIPVWSGGNGDTRRISLATLAAYLQTLLQAAGDYITQYAAPSATGFNVAVSPPTAGANTFLLLTPAAGYAAGTITLPAQASCVDGQELLCTCTQSVTTLTIAGNGSTLNGAPTTIAANGFFNLRFDGVFKAWYRVG